MKSESAVLISARQLILCVRTHNVIVVFLAAIYRIGGIKKKEIVMKIFLSFAYDEDSEQVNGFRGMLENPNADINFTDGSCKKDYAEKPDYVIEQYIKTLIDISSVTVCLISNKTKKSNWVERELSISKEKHKGIIGILLKNQDSYIKDLSGCPRFFQENKNYKVFKWDTPENIEENIKNAEKAR